MLSFNNHLNQMHRLSYYVKVLLILYLFVNQAIHFWISLSKLISQSTLQKFVYDFLSYLLFHNHSIYMNPHVPFFQFSPRALKGFMNYVRFSISYFLFIGVLYSIMTYSKIIISYLGFKRHHQISYISF